MGWLLNRAIRACGDPSGYFAYLTDDAVWGPRHLERLRAVLDADPEFVAACSKSRIFHEGATLFHHLSGPLPDIMTSEQVLTRSLVCNFIGHHELMHRGQLTWTEDPTHWREPDWTAWKTLAKRPGYWRFTNELDSVLYNDSRDIGASLQSGTSLLETLRRKDDPDNA